MRWFNLALTLIVVVGAATSTPIWPDEKKKELKVAAPLPYGSPKHQTARAALSKSNKEGPACLNAFFTITDGPHGVFACRGLAGSAIYAQTMPDGAYLSNDRHLTYQGSYFLEGIPGWVYKEVGKRQWFFSFLYDQTGGKTTYQKWSDDGGMNWAPSTGWIMLRAVPFGEFKKAREGR